MDIKLPDGTILQDVPEGTTQQQILQRLYETKHPSYKAVRYQMMKDRPWGSGMSDLAYQLGANMTDLFAKDTKFPKTAAALGLPKIAPEAGYVTNVLAQAIPAFATAGRFIGSPTTSVAERPAEMLMQSAVKPTQVDRASGAAGKAIGTMLREDISPTTSGMDKAANLARSLDQQVESAIAASPETVSLNAVGQRLQEPAKRALTQVNPNQDIEAVKSVWNEFKNSPLVRQAASQGAVQGTPNVPAVQGAQAAQDVQLPVQLAHALKKGTYQSLGGKSYGEIGSSSTEAQKALARGLREEVGNAVPQSLELLKREASLMNVKDVATNRALLEANKNPMGLAALRIGDNPLSSAAFLADRSAYLKGLTARLLFRGGQPEFAVPYGVSADAIKNKMQERGQEP